MLFVHVRNYMYHPIRDLSAPYIFFIQEHPEMKFSHPVHRITDSGEIRFTSSVSPAIMQGSENQELAWEFLRFTMEYSKSLFENFHEYHGNIHHFPVNRQMFENQVHAILSESYRIMVRFNKVTVTGDVGLDYENKKEQVEYALDRFRQIVESLNVESRHNQAVLNSLIYPDIYLFMTGQQDVDRTLENIQNRLEIYVAE